jgi:hypothetical protein
VNTAGASLSSSSATATTNSRVQNVSMLNGIITASVVESGAQATSDGTNATYADTGTITNLVVNGNPVTVTGGATITVAGVGVLIVHRVIRFGTSIEVRGLDLLVTQPNVLGLSIGTNVLVAVARASIL